MRTTWLARVVVLAATMLALSATGASARLLWGEPQPLRAGEVEPMNAELVAHPDGGLSAAWVEGYSSRGGAAGRVWSATRPAGGSWPAPEQVAPGAAGVQREVRLARGPDGTLTAVWWQDFESLASATRPPGGGWSAPTTVAVDGVIAAGDLAVDEHGNAAAAWGARTQSGWAIEVARRAPGGAWGRPEQIAVVERPERPRVAAGDGAVAVVWKERWGTVTPVHGSFRPAAGLWGAATELDPAGFGPDVGFGPDGSAFAVWSRDGGAVVAADRAVSDSSWGTPTTVGAGAGVALGVTADDGALAVWGSWDDGTSTFTAHAAERTAGGRWLPAETAASVPLDARPAFRLDGARDADGDVTVTWNDDGWASAGSQWAASRKAGAAWGDPAIVDWFRPLLALAVTPDGTVAAAWGDSDELRVGLAVEDPARPPRRTPAGGFAPPPAAIDALAPNGSSDVAVARDGSAVAVWDAEDASGVWDVWTAQRSRAGRWSAPARLSADDGVDDWGAGVVVDRRGVATAAWQHGPYGEMQGLAARRARRGGWSAPQAVSTRQRLLRRPALAVDRRGDVTVAWVTGSSDRGVESATYRRGRGWQAPTTLATGGWATDVAVAARDGRAVVVWQRSSPDLGPVWAAYRPGRDSAWQPETQLSPAGERAQRPAAGFDRSGMAVVVWSTAEGAVRSVERSAGGAWSVPQTVGQGAPLGWDGNRRYGSDLALGVGPRGHMLAVWGDDDGLLRRVRAAARHPRGGWAAPGDVVFAGAPTESFSVALNRRGAAAVTWNEGSRVVGTWRRARGRWQPTEALSPVAPTAGLHTAPRVVANGRGDLAATWRTHAGFAAIGGRVR